MKIYNSLTQRKEEFVPLDPAKKAVKMYVCGPTVYDEPHIGHLRSAYVFDMMRRYLTHSGYEVKFVRNVTDVDDKIIDKARQVNPADLNAEVLSVSDKYLKLYQEDLRTLGILEPTHEPKATGHIQEMQWLIQKLIERGAAYASAGDVYFSVNAFKNYGKLSHQDQKAILENVRIDKNDKKRDVLDFALWKSVKEGEPSWPSPWGPGRPGWHIECSAMSMKYLGQTFDIHGGGRDLIFPHHENEVAQSEAVTGSPFARYWVHHGLITVNEQKMSKSLKNFITLGQIARTGPNRIEELKFLFLGTHYSAPLDYSEEKMKMEASIRHKFIHFLAECGESAEASKDSGWPRFKTAFEEAMHDDFNTPLAMTVMHELVAYAKKPENAGHRAAAGALLKSFFKILNLSCEETLVSIPEEVMQRIDSMIVERKEAKSRKEYAVADKLRTEIDAIASRYGKKLVDLKDGNIRIDSL